MNHSLSNLFFSLTENASLERSGHASLNIRQWDFRMENFSVGLKRRYLFGNEEEASVFEARVKVRTERSPLFAIAHKMSGHPRVCVILRIKPEHEDIVRAAELVVECERLYRSRFAPNAESVA